MKELLFVPYAVLSHCDMTSHDRGGRSVNRVLFGDAIAGVDGTRERE